MSNTALDLDTASMQRTTTDRELLQDALAHAGHLLPAQPPIHTFVHHNTLHAFEHLEFDAALREASALFSTKPYLSEADFSKHLASGRIDTNDIDAELARESGGSHRLWPDGPTRRDLWRYRLLNAFPIPDEQTIAWLESEEELFRHIHDSVPAGIRAQWRLKHPGQALSRGLTQLWTTILAATPAQESTDVGIRLRDHLLRGRDFDIDDLVRPLLIRLAGAYIDQGIAEHSMPGRADGFVTVVRTLYIREGRLSERWLKRVSKCFQEFGTDATEIILSALQFLEIPNDQWQQYILETLLMLKGWAGMFHQYELHPERLPVRSIPATLLDYLAVQLTFECGAIDYACRKFSISSIEALKALPDGRDSSEQKPGPDLVLAYETFVTAQGLTLGSDTLSRGGVVKILVDEVKHFESVTRRRILHEAYERHYRSQVLSSLSQVVPERQLETPLPSLQAVFCMDEREESLRRHLEEIEPAIETFGFAGFFGVPMEYRGLDDVRSRPLCPVTVTPSHLIDEVPVDAESAARYRHTQQRRGRAANRVEQVRYGSLLGGAWAVVAGSLKILPLIGCSLFPHTFSSVSHRISEFGVKRPRTRLRIETEGENDADTGLIIGFTIDEMTSIVGGVLETMGLNKKFSALVMIVGHGSSSLNNPHEAAHDCGATGGGRGGPNARAFAAMANHPEVRVKLKEKDINIPEDTWFVGAYHNTCDDSMSYFDTESIPATRLGEFERAQALFEQACIFDAHERCRRFESTPTNLDIADAMRHAEEHAADLGQPRPEYGHATNAICIIGRRHNTRGLYMDRRAFLISYDPERDQQGETLANLMAAAAPVGAGISLEYYFSFVDPAGYGCATKLPHNITGLVGVVDGHSSDLRTGLPWQMVEIHEPMRLLTIVEATPEVLHRVVDERPEVADLVLNNWIQLVSLDPYSGELKVFEDGGFVSFTASGASLPEVQSSIDFYSGYRKHLGFARVRKGINNESA